MAGLVVLEKMIMLVILMMVGFGAAKARWVDAAFNQVASKLVTNVFIACTIAGSVMNVEPLLSGGELLLAIGAIFLTFLIGGGIGWVVSRCLKLKGHERNVAWLSIFFMNNVFVGFPVVEAVFGPDAIFCASLSNLPFNLLLYTIGVANLRAGEGRGRVKFREIFSIPLIATFVAIVLFLTRLPVPKLVADVVTTLGSATVPMSMLIGEPYSAHPLPGGGLAGDGALPPPRRDHPGGVYRHRRLPQRRHDHHSEHPVRGGRQLCLQDQLFKRRPLRRHPAAGDLFPPLTAAFPPG